ncbi:MAG: hypothetical protein U9O89_02815 [Thermoproteota archaeon]|nr:hypothetical protein [Thermoproteota archaeon]
MDTTTFRILDTVSAYLGKSFSINQLTRKIKEVHGTAYYANIYKKLHDLKEKGIINLNKSGKSSIIDLNFQNYLLIDFLTEMEIRKKIEFLKRKTDLQMFLTDMDRCFSNLHSIKSICSIDSEKNSKLNKMELLFLLKDQKEGADTQDEIARIHKELQKLQGKHNLRVDSLILDECEFFDLLESDEMNPLKEILSKKTAFFRPQAFWSEVREILEKGVKIRTREKETKPADISEMDLIYNLARFGYKDFGSRMRQGQKICIEYIITSLLLQGDVRRIESTPIILAKHGASSNLMVFLAQKFGVSERLLGLLKILANIKPTKEVDRATKLLESLNVKEVEADERSILQKMRLYNAA